MKQQDYSIYHCRMLMEDFLELQKKDVLFEKINRVLYLQQSVLIRLICTSNNCLIERRFFAVNRVLYLS